MQAEPSCCHSAAQLPTLISLNHLIWFFLIITGRFVKNANEFDLAFLDDFSKLGFFYFLVNLNFIVFLPPMNCLLLYFSIGFLKLTSTCLILSLWSQLPVTLTLPAPWSWNTLILAYRASLVHRLRNNRCFSYLKYPDRLHRNSLLYWDLIKIIPGQFINRFTHFYYSFVIYWWNANSQVNPSYTIDALEFPEELFFLLDLAIASYLSDLWRR